ncbi:MAG: glycosyltransferase family 2 protein [Bacteroidetes bacterium]|nr:glycosyltransferase family 2 protein [Bacteroidota bacterium]
MPVELSVITPLLNEEKNVYELYSRLRAAMENTNGSYEIILVDDGSTDFTLQAIEKIASEDSHVKFISFSRNFGHQLAIYAGLEKCSGNRIVLIDGDLQDPPEIINKLLEKMNEGFDVVYARRSMRKGESFLKKITAKLFYRILNRITSINIPVDTGDFRIMNRKVADELLKMKDHNKFLRGQIAWLGFKETSITYEREQRKNGNTNFSYGTMFRFAIDGITGFSNFPLKFASICGILVSLLAFVFIIYILLAKLVWHETVSGWASIMVTVLFLGGIQLLSVGIIGEYISRINDAVRNRQLYIIDKTNME